MRFATPLVPARLVRRSKRFLAEMVLADWAEVVAHCPNPGAMTGLAEPGTRCWIERNDDPRKRLRWGWRLVEADGGLVGIDTVLPNRVLKAALLAGEVPGLPPYDTVRAEVPYGDGSRVDFVLGGAAETHVEVKSVTLSRGAGLAAFPDCVTARGARHLAELGRVAAAGGRAVTLFLVQRTDARAVTLAADIDPAYGRAFAAARAAGMAVLCLGTRITPEGVTLGGPLPFHPGG